MNGPSTLGSLGLHIPVSNWICKASGIVWNKQILRFCFTEVHSQCCGHRTCINPLFRPRGYMWGTRNGHGLQKVTTVFFPGKVSSSSWPYSQLSIDTSVYRPLLPPQKQGLSKCSDQICYYHKNGFIFCCVGKSQEDYKIWLELFVTNHVFTASAIDVMHITQVIVYSNFIKVIYEDGNRCGIIYLKFLEHGDFLDKRFLHNLEHHP